MAILRVADSLRNSMADRILAAILLWKYFGARERVIYYDY